MKLLALLAMGALQLPLTVLGMRASLGFKETLMAASEKTSVSFAAMPFDLRTDLLMAEGVATHAVANDDYSNSIFGPDGRILCTESATVNNTGEVTVVLAFSKCLNDTALGIVEEWVNQVKVMVATIAAEDDLTLTFQSTMVPGACEERSEKTKQGLEDPDMVNQDGAEDDPAQCSLVAHPGKLYTGDVCEPVRTGLTMTECCEFCRYSPCCWHFSYIHHNKTCSPYYAVNGQLLFSGGIAGNYSASWLAEEELPTQLQAQEVLASDLKRLEAFPGLGEVVAMANDGVTTTPIAVISFVTGETSYGEVMQYENSMHVSNTFNFQICNGGTNCNGVFENCIQLQETADVFMYNPFTVTRSLECNNLAGGVPVTYKDDYGARQCFCGCPAGFEMKENDYGNQVCEQVVEEPCPCVWAERSEYKHSVTTDEAVCSFHDVATDWGFPVPFPTDGYVADKRDTLSEGYMNPRIALSVVRVQDPEYQGCDVRHLVGATAQLPLLYSDVVAINAKASSLVPLVGGGSDESTHSTVSTWKDYQMNRVATIDAMEFPSYGKYELDMDAYDYYSSATCDGCLAIVDKNRPKATTTCPASFCDEVSGQQHCTDTAELTVANLETANGLVAQYLDFADKATNDACSDDDRCDSKAFSRRDFYENDYEDESYSSISQCFDKDSVIDDFLCNDKSKRNPLKRGDGSCDDTAEPVPAGQCTRCCKMATTLKEWWTDYRCGSDYDVRSCEGDVGQTCEFKQCLVMNGDTLATVTAAIKQEVQAESQSVLSQVEQQGYQTVTQVHHALDCTSFGGDDGNCDFTAKLSELIDTTQDLTFNPGSHGEVEDYIHWRYKLVATDEKWRLWKTGMHDEYGSIVYDNDDELTFTAPQTKISVEAWTECGLVRRFFFYVHLHVNSPIDVCDKFGSMWYQTSVSRLPVGTNMCAYPGSDFAELTFDFHPNAGLQYSRTELQMHVSEVVCTGTLENRTPVEILRVDENSPEIVTRFAVEMLNKIKTEAATDFHVSCAFKYSQYGGAARTETCERDFSIAACKGPEFDTPNGECEYEACAGEAEAGLYEACGGTVIKATDTCTYVETGEKSCCQGCADTTVTCTALLNLPNEAADIMRCEPTGSSSAYATYYAAMLLTDVAQEHPATTALLSATALIAVVALVVVRRRVTTAHAAQMADDAYYPLLH